MSQDETRTDRAQPPAAEFRTALRRGTGRAAILLQREPHDPALNAELLRACVENLAYDPQCEARRAPYLCELIRITGQQDAYRDALEGRLRAATSDAPVLDVEQVLGILARLAERDGNGIAVLRDFVLVTGDRALAVAVAPELIRLEGLDALLACARRFGPGITEDWWLFDAMVDTLEERDGAEPAKAALRDARQGDPALDGLLCLVEEKRKPSDKPSAVPDYATLKAKVGARGGFPRAWITGASQDDIEHAAEDLFAETDDARIQAYLRIFLARSFPGDPTRLFPFLASTNRRIAWFAASILGRISHPAIRDRALQLIAEGQHNLGARMLRSSHGKGDLVLLGTLLDQLASDEDAYHGVGLSTLNLIEYMAEKPEQARAVLLHLYENGPCSICRWRVVDQLAAMGDIPAWMADEGRYDAEPGIAERFRAPVPQGQ